MYKSDLRSVFKGFGERIHVVITLNCTKIPSYLRTQLRTTDLILWFCKNPREDVKVPTINGKQTFIEKEETWNTTAFFVTKTHVVGLKYFSGSRK